MFKKKRLAMLFVLAVGACVAVFYSVWVAAAGVGLLVVLMAALSLFHVAWAHRGMTELAAAQDLHGYDRLVRAAERRYTENGRRMRFVALGDTRSNRKVTRAVYERAASESPVAIFHAGDIIRHGTPREFLGFHLKTLEAIGGIPMFCVPGNHERGARRDFAAFKALYGDTRFAFELGPCFFIGFNNSTRKRIEEEDLRWLDAELARTRALRRFLFIHIPPRYFEEKIVRDDRRRGFKEHAQEFHEILKRHHVDEVFMAHIHGYASAVIDGVRYTLTAGGGAPLSGRMGPEGKVYNYVVVDVDEEGVRRRVMRSSGGEWQASGD